MEGSPTSAWEWLIFGDVGSEPEVDVGSGAEADEEFGDESEAEGEG